MPPVKKRYYAAAALASAFLIVAVGIQQKNQMDNEADFFENDPIENTIHQTDENQEMAEVQIATDSISPPALEPNN